MTFLPQTSLTLRASVNAANRKQNDLSSTKCCHFSASAASGQARGQPTANHLTLSEEERPAGPSTVTHVNINAFFLPMSHCTHLTLKRKTQE